MRESWEMVTSSRMQDMVQTRKKNTLSVTKLFFLLLKCLLLGFSASRAHHSQRAVNIFGTRGASKIMCVTGLSLAANISFRKNKDSAPGNAKTRENYGTQMKTL